MNNDFAKAFVNDFDVAWQDYLKKMGFDQIQMVHGQRLRPLLVWWGYTLAKNTLNLSDRDKITVIDAAICIETVHKSSIILDDWIDQDGARHGKNAFHVDHGDAKTVMTSILMLCSIINNILEPLSPCKDTNNNLLNVIMDTMSKMATGQLLELNLSDNERYDIEKIKSIIELETGALLANSILVGYIAANGAPNNIEFLKRIGYRCGYIFQALNDLEPILQSGSKR